MSSTFSGLSAAISGLYANKRSLDTVSHNIANVNNPYYVRQQAIHSSSRYTRLSDGRYSVGTGVNIQEIRQIRDEFLDLKFRAQSQEFGYWSARDSIFEQVQGIVNEMSDSGLQKVMDQFWNSWEELSKDPDNLTIRGLVKERAIAFTETVNHMYNQVDMLQNNLNKDIKNTVNEINSIARQIADLNEKIKINEVNGIKANDYRDSRNYLLDRLSQLISIDYAEASTGVVNVSVGGKSLVNSSEYNEMFAWNGSSSFVDVVWKDTLDYPQPVKVIEDGLNLKGELVGLINGRGDVDSTILGKNNGSVNEEVEYSFIYDASISNVGNIINEYENDIEQRGLDVTSPYPYKSDFSGDIDEIITYINTNFDTADESHKKLIIACNNDVTNLTDEKIETLKSLGVSISIISDKSSNWDKITDATGGKLFDINKITSDNNEQKGFAKELAQETTNTASKYMGEISGYREIIPSIKQKLNTFVNTIARNINYLHRQGYTLTKESGKDFFVAMDSSKPIEAGNIKINDELDTLNNISVSDTNGEIGNGKIAEQIAGLRELYLFGKTNCDDYYRDIIADMGVAANEAVTMLDSQEIIKEQVDFKRNSISGVSLDEEMTDMLKYQHSYVASTRVINTIDEMVENIINRMGRVGL